MGQQPGPQLWVTGWQTALAVPAMRGSGVRASGRLLIEFLRRHVGSAPCPSSEPLWGRGEVEHVLPLRNRCTLQTGVSSVLTEVAVKRRRDLVARETVLK